MPRLLVDKNELFPDSSYSMCVRIRISERSTAKHTAEMKSKLMFSDKQQKTKRVAAQRRESNRCGFSLDHNSSELTSVISVVGQSHNLKPPSEDKQL